MVSDLLQNGIFQVDFRSFKIVDVKILLTSVSRFCKYWLWSSNWWFNWFQFSSVAQSCLTLCDPMDCSTPGLPVHHQLPEFTQTHVHWVGDTIQPSHPLSPLPLPPSIFPSIKVFSNESVLHIRWPNIGVSASFLPVNIQDWFPLRWTGWISLQSSLLTVKSLIQHHSSKASILQHSAFFIVQLSHPYMTTRKSKALTKQTFVGKVI